MKSAPSTKSTETNPMKIAKNVVISFIIISLLFAYCHTKSQVEEVLAQVELKDQTFKIQKDKSNQQFAIQEQRILELNDENMKLVKTIKEFKTIKNQTQVGTNTIIKEVKIPYEVQVIQYIDTLNRAYFVKVPLPFSKNDTFFSIKGKVGLKNLVIDSLTIPNTLTITTGLTKGGFFKRDKYEVEVVSDNPHSQITKLKNTQFEPKTPWYKSRGLAFGIGFLLPFFIIFK